MWKKDIFGDSEVFKVFYEFVFDYLKEDRKILSLTEAKMLWSVLDMSSRWCLWNQFSDYLIETKKREYISRDEWNLALAFAKEHPEGVEEYDEDGPWPSLIDDFVSHLKGDDEE